MKKTLSLLVVLLLAMTVVLAGCKKEEPLTPDTPGTETPQTPGTDKPDSETPDKTDEGKDLTIGLVTDTGGIDDKSFNQGTWEGIDKFSKETGASTKYLQSESDADYVPNLSTFADQNLDLIVAPGFLFFDSLTEVARNFPDQKFLLIDSVVDAPNVANAMFAEEQGSFLVGVAAALKTKEAGKNVVGFIGGMDFDSIQSFESGFEAGVKAVDENIQVLIEYAGSFTDTQIGQTLAAKLYDQGAYVIYHAAGNTGNGLIKEAKDRRTNGQDVWAIGVDKDQYDDGIYEDGKSAILTSMMKRVDTAAYDVSKSVMEGNFQGGTTLTYSLANDGVGIPASNPNLSDEIEASVAEYAAKIKSGEITVSRVPSRIQGQ